MMLEWMTLGEDIFAALKNGDNLFLQAKLTF